MSFRQVHPSSPGESAHSFGGLFIVPPGSTRPRIQYGLTCEGLNHQTHRRLARYSDYYYPRDAEYYDEEYYVTRGGLDGPGPAVDTDFSIELIRRLERIVGASYPDHESSMHVLSVQDDKEEGGVDNKGRGKTVAGMAAKNHGRVDKEATVKEHTKLSFRKLLHTLRLSKMWRKVSSSIASKSAAGKASMTHRDNTPNYLDDEKIIKSSTVADEAMMTAAAPSPRFPIDDGPVSPSQASAKTSAKPSRLRAFRSLFKHGR